MALEQILHVEHITIKTVGVCICLGITLYCLLTLMKYFFTVF